MRCMQNIISILSDSEIFENQIVCEFCPDIYLREKNIQS